MASPIDFLPDEILEYILNLIPPYKDLKECMLVCKRWHHAVKHVIEHRKAYFQRSVAYGSLLWNSPAISERPSIITNRHSHSACTYENSMYIFGGCTKTGTTFNDLWKLDLDTRKWERPIPMGTYPSPKACASMVYYKKSFVLYGGWAQPATFPPFQRRKLFNELHIYSITNNKWTAIETLNDPPATCAHSATVHGNLMVVFGGISTFLHYNTSNDIWCFNLETHTWHEQITTSPKPHPRFGHSQIALDDKNLMIIGGCTNPTVGIDDAWLLTMEGTHWRWTKLTINGLEWAPMMIWCHQACKVGEHLIILSKKKQASASSKNVTNDKVICHGPSSLAMAECNLPDTRQKSVPVVDRDENVNGRRGRFTPRPGVLVNSARAINNTRPHPGIRVAVERKFGPMAAFNPDLGTPSPNRLRQLEDLRRMEERINRQRMEARLIKTNINRLAIFVLNIANVLREDHSASWIQNSGKDLTGPEERVLYSLVLGNAELIFFGGTRKFPTKQGQIEGEVSEVYNDVHFINPPRYAI
ncbi:GSCOCG00004472001-RA-CDS [Cotesia congregata]|uniref:Similar to FBXO42: F-box only protein 42 (Homo sapiens) n=1 Tax=Cotesia congregata TaxID=51543 RepID=A0A8J2MM17_COTCN|nr:GSCOCG00004472001-RA-CDS [Cotesia congregata]CAG5095296.1 Similar to FBXO42: F-box only protein 42 (Homo sapiens) [Cotesia congregata]